MLFVFAFFITRRNASQSGEGKKECEEKHFIDHRYWLPVLRVSHSERATTKIIKKVSAKKPPSSKLTASLNCCQ
ncbi:hypothetical protein A6J67_08310 [Yersinia sp. FDAARGOS_228]|nr:hypothetical protein A6J67_08310 [Yersinia sp. FDAARGOS_228]